MLRCRAASTVVHEVKHRAPYAHNTAVTIRSDGTATASWTDGGLAVTVDPEDEGGGFKLFAMYRGSGMAAASFDRSGGYVQFPNGAIFRLLSCYKRSDKKPFQRTMCDGFCSVAHALQLSCACLRSLRSIQLIECFVDHIRLRRLVY